ncbi:MAG TPA: hypothetical protein VHF89_13725 [Solirubrobacteraceae bacterium]|nr:hypothetical protein [Solirubrobacteraceae bacterium]
MLRAMSLSRRLACPALAAAALAIAAGPAAAALERPSGRYTAQGGRFELRVSGGVIGVVGFDFRCRRTLGRTSLTEVRIRKARGRYRFSIRTYGIATYRDDHPDENARIRFRGAFSPNARRVTGTFSVRSPHCGSTGPVQWAASRR